jgi:hypothetical protein
MLRGLRGRTNTTTNSSSLEASTKTAQFYDKKFLLCDLCGFSPCLSAPSASSRRTANIRPQQTEGRSNRDPAAPYHRNVKKLSNRADHHAQRRKSL